MKLSSTWSAFGLALLAAVANAIFIAAQKHVPAGSNPFYFLIFSLGVSLGIWLLLSCFFPSPPAWTYLQQNGLWISLGGTGFALLSVCFHQLFNQYGLSYYTLYAVLAILTTSLFSGIVFFQESYNRYTLLSVGCACLSILFFALSKK